MIHSVEQGPLWLFLGGAISSVNPCMLAAVPLVAGYVGSGKKSYFIQSILFLLGFAGTLALFGLSIGALGGISQALQSKWPFILALLYFLLGSYLTGLWQKLLSLIGLKIVAFYQTSFKMKIPLPKQGSHFGAFGLGSVMAFTPSPCITPVIVSVLAYIAPSGEALKGAFYLFSFGIGHGLPLLLAGSGAGILVTKLRQMNLFRYINPIFGFILILLSVYFLISGL